MRQPTCRPSFDSLHAAGRICGVLWRKKRDYRGPQPNPYGPAHALMLRLIDRIAALCAKEEAARYY